MTLFSNLTPAPDDPILGLSEAFAQDTNPAKINLGVGVYKDPDGQTPVLAAVKEAERLLLERETSKSYLPMQGHAGYGQVVREMLLGADHVVLREGRAMTAQTPGGTGALRVAGDYLNRMHPDAAIWLPNPTWANHKGVFTAAGLTIHTYPWYNADTRSLDFDALMDAFQSIPEGDVVLLHGCCQNPTGADPSTEQWAEIASVLTARGLIPLVDIAYQGFAAGLDEDAHAVRLLANTVPELFVCSSYSKNFSLYNERVGALTVVGANSSDTATAFGHVKLSIRTNYSNPPAHGAAIVATVLQDADLAAQWTAEVDTMRTRINGMRHLFVDTLRTLGVQQDFSFLTEQRGMFSFSGLTPEQVARLRDEYAIYVVGSGRINVAGMTEANMMPLCEAIKAVL